MRRPAGWRFGALSCATFVACWTGKPDTTTLANHLEPAAQDLAKSYYCSIDQDGYDYPRFACVIKKIDGAFVLAKLGGSQRFHGRVVPDGHEGFTFVGELYCPWGDCTQKLHGEFKPMGHGELQGRFREDSMVVTLAPAPDGAFGGAAYGGDGYGDPYGGAGYGGATYARPNRIDSRGRHRP
jgi:hypothetical protein